MYSVRPRVVVLCSSEPRRRGAREIILSWWGFKSMKSIINKSLGGTASGLMSDQAYALPSKKCPGPGLLQTCKLVAQKTRIGFTRRTPGSQLAAPLQQTQIQRASFDV